MIIWFVFGGMAAIVGLVMAATLMFGRRDIGSAAGFDLKVYRDQLREIDRDAARNLVPAEEAERLRTEIARRILAADTKAQAGGTDLVQTPQRGIGHKIAAVVLAAGTVGGAFALYMQMGAPRYGDLPLASRIAMAQEALDSRPSQAQAEARIPAKAPADVPADYLELVAQLRDTVGERPNDLQGHVYLARTEAALGNYIAAYTAQKRVIALKGARVTAEDHAILADLHILAAGGYVSPEADAALRAALQIDPSQGLARYYVGQLMAQNGRPDVAFQMWRNVLNESAPTDPWVPAIREQIEELALLAGDVNYRLPPAAPLAAPLAGPSSEDMAAAQDMSEAERAEMIQGMVARLSDRLATQGGPPAEWARLIRAYGILGDRNAAQAIYVEARTVFAGQDSALRDIYRAAQDAEIVN